MKATELRIGNFVYDRLLVQKIKQITKGFEIDNTDRIKPIPLTEEWLLKFGALEIEICDETGYLYSEYIIHLENYEDIYFIDNEIKSYPNIKYIHQLQNLYFALTGQELTTKTNNK